MSGLVEADEAPGLNTGTEEPLNPLDLRKWTQFVNVEPQLLLKVKLAHIFGTTGATTGLLIRADDQVYSVGSNQNGCLGIGSTAPGQTTDPLKVEALCGQGVSTFSSARNGTFCFALTKSGQTYGWGYNGHSELGLGTTTAVLIPTLVEGLKEKVVVQIACGPNYTLALTSEGEVYAWGYNRQGQIGNGTTATQSTPLKISEVIGDIKISELSCGYYHSLALSKDGEVFAWGYNSLGQLGTGTTANETKPVKITLPENIKITKIVCGRNHSIALANNGTVYCWGDNGHGQLGNGTQTNSPTPIQVQDLTNVTDIASINYEITVCRTVGGKIYIWGQIPGASITSPRETHLTSIQDAFWFYTNPQVTSASLVFDPFAKTGSSLASNLEKAFNDQSTSSTTDVKFFSESENKSIHVHKAFLELQSPQIKKKFAGEWQAGLQSSIKIDPISYTSFHALLYFFYSDKIEFPEDDFQNIIDLLRLADEFCETRLSRECELILIRKITLQNALGLYLTATKHNAKNLEEFAFRFMLQNRKQMGFESELKNHELDIEHWTKLVVELAKQ